MRLKSVAVFVSTVLILLSLTALASAVETDACINCHKASGVLGGIIQDWEGSEHAKEGVTCKDCHQVKSGYPGAIAHNGFKISPVVSPEICGKCHSKEAGEFKQSLHSLGARYYEYLFSKEKLPYLESQLEGGYIVSEGQDITHAATLRGCQACHGTNMTGTDTNDPLVWPNNGIGRINPDGSLGSCAACHSRHKFSIAEARHPETCGQCHLGPDHPQVEIYQESKHGNIYAAEGESWNWSKGDWKAGIDYRAPTCASCHMSSAPGVPATHDISSRLSWELESPLSRHTDNTANSLGDKISDGSSWQEKRSRMQSVCKQCHSTTWTENYYKQADIAVELYNKQYTEAKEDVDKLYQEGLLTKTSFDEPIEFKIYEMWHHEGRRARMGAFMMGPDYTQWHGFYEMFRDKIELKVMEEEIRNRDSKSNTATAAQKSAGIGIVAAITAITGAALIGRRRRQR